MLLRFASRYSFIALDSLSFPSCLSFDFFLAMWPTNVFFDDGFDAVADVRLEAAPEAATEAFTEAAAVAGETKVLFTTTTSSAPSDETSSSLPVHDASSVFFLCLFVQQILIFIVAVPVCQ